MSPFVLVKLVCCGIFVLKFCAAVSTEVVKGSGTEINRKHVAVWFDYSVRYHEYEADNAYSKRDIKAMVNVVARRFSKIAIDVAPVVDKLPPKGDAHSRIWIPEVVAERNKIHKGALEQTMEVIVTFSVARLVDAKSVTSFDVANFMANMANKIYPGTVNTLMMQPGFGPFASYYRVENIVGQLKEARRKIDQNARLSANFNYTLAVLLDYKDCGHFNDESLGWKAKELVSNVESVVVLLRPHYHHMSLPPKLILGIFNAKFEDCEKRLKEYKPNIRIMPLVLLASRNKSVSFMTQTWEMMSKWGEKKENDIILFEAFDTPRGHLLSDQGWFQYQKGESQHDIKEESFFEKAQEMTNSLHQVDRGSTSQKPGVVGGKSTFYEKGVGGATKNTTTAYTAMVLVICIILVAVIVGLVYVFCRFGGVKIFNQSVCTIRLLLRSRQRMILPCTRSSYPKGSSVQLDSQIDYDERIDDPDDSLLKIVDKPLAVSVAYKR